MPPTRRSSHRAGLRRGDQIVEVAVRCVAATVTTKADRDSFAIGLNVVSGPASASIACSVTNPEWMHMSVWPSGRACATLRAAISPPAPARLSTRKRWPSGLAERLRQRTDETSSAPPVGAGTMIVTMPVGQFVTACAAASGHAPVASQPNAARRDKGVVIVSTWNQGDAGEL